MAIAVMNWVWKHSRAKNGARLVLLAIADACNSDDGTGAWPSNPELRGKTLLSERAVQSGLAELQRIGELKVGYNEGPNGCNTYTVLVTAMTPADSAGGADSAPPQDPHPAGSTPPQNSHQTPADSASTPAESAPGTTTEPSGTTTSPPSGERPRGRASTRKRASKSNGSTSNRGTRIPDDFASTITAEMVTWVRENCPNVDGKDQTNRFVDFWVGKSGKDGTKLNWVATWRNWMRREQDKFGSPSGNGRASPNSNGSNFAGNTGARASTPTAEEIDAMDLEGQV